MFCSAMGNNCYNDCIVLYLCLCNKYLSHLDEFQYQENVEQHYRMYQQVNKKTLIRDTYSKTVFFANNKLYQQIDGVSMGSSLGPLLANIIITEMVKTIIKKIICDKILLFYGRYVEDTLVVIRPVQDALKHFDKNLNFTVDIFDNIVPDFLDIEIHPDDLSIYC